MLKLPSLGTIVVIDDWPYACADFSKTFGQEMTLCG